MGQIMRTIGLLGGMSWESSAEYYRMVNCEVKRRLGGLHSAKLVLFSVDFSEIERLQHSGDWDGAGAILISAAQSIERAGAECLVICTNTMHLLADTIAASISMPLLHIADATAERIKHEGLKKVGLLGTRFTMEREFYRGRLESHHGLSVVVPDDTDRAAVHRIIYNELCLGEIRDESRAIYDQIVARLVENGAEGVILGCTEIGLLLKTAAVPLFDTARIHAEAAVEWSLS